MDAKTLAGKTLFFILICIFVSVFESEFGQENSLVGVIVIVLALTLLGRDLSVKPAQSLGMMLASTLCMGLFSFVSIQCGNPYIGAVLNFTFIFTICFVTMRDLVSPMHFPLLLGYTFMLTEPVTTEGLTTRVVALVLGSVFIVCLNYIFNHGKRKKEKLGIAKVCDEVISCCERAMAGSNTNPSELVKLCNEVNRNIYYHLEDRFYSSPNDRALLDLVVSLQVIGTAVSDRERDTRTLEDLRSVVEKVAGAQRDEIDTDDVLSSIDTFLISHPDADREVLSGLRTMRDELWRIGYRTSGYVPDGHRTSRSFVAMSVLRETMRRDSVRFTFSFRMALIFTLCAFIWQYSGEDNAKALMFTTIAMVQPYVEGTWVKTVMRLTGTFIGITAVVCTLLVTGGDISLLTIAILFVNYIFTVLDPKRFDVMIAFVTFSSLLTVVMTGPADAILTGRLEFILLGVLIAYVANHVVMPYHIRDENIQLARRYIGITDDQIGNVGKAARGERDAMESVALVLTAATVSAKINMNLSREDDYMMGRFLAGQDSLTARCRMISRSMYTAGPGCRRMVSEMVTSRGSPPTQSWTDTDLEEFEPQEKDMIREVSGMIEDYHRDAMILDRLGDPHLR